MTVLTGARRSMPFVSVLMAVYNGDKWLGESIRSVLEQTYVDFEFIIVNDGSTDSSLEIINNFAETDARICVVDKINTGLADSLNCGLVIANGKWIARLDADDVCMPERLQVLHEYVSSRPDLVLVGSSFIEIDGLGCSVKEQRYPSNHAWLLNNLERHKRFFPHSSAFFRADSARELQGYNPRIVRSQDHDFWLRLSAKGKIACLNMPLVQIRQHGDQISHEESGFRQLYYDYASTICHFLRKRRIVDPSIDLDMVAWLAFLDWVKTEVNSQLDLMSNLEFRRYSRFLLRNSEPGLFRYIKILSRIVLSGRLYGMLWERFWGTSLPRRLAAKWQSVNLLGEFHV
jgi:glycosyltransferase involved in cell wall biosynthesis